MDKNKCNALNEVLERIATELSITDDMITKAEDSYKAVGKWLGDGIEYNLTMIPQGSMGLGTTIKPISDEDDYDIDIVVLLSNGQTLTAYQIKNLIGDRLKENKFYAEKLKQEGEGKRCWKMQYNEFHMDLLPSVPKSLYDYPTITDIRLTHKDDNGVYVDRYSNPEGYRIWFEKRMLNILEIRKRDYSIRNQVELKEVPTYRVKTPLQMAIQLLKRHRDIMFKDNSEIAPISIIITTLAAHAYNGEENLFVALNSIVNKMEKYIVIREGQYFIYNPVMADENFADKWASNDELRKAFFRWLSRIKNDLLFNNIDGIDEYANVFRSMFGDRPVTRAMNKYGDDLKKARECGTLKTKGLCDELVITSNIGVVTNRQHTFFGE